jgi:hypothetical protein
METVFVIVGSVMSVAMACALFELTRMSYVAVNDAKKFAWGIAIGVILLWFFFGPRPWAFW